METTLLDKSIAFSANIFYRLLYEAMSKKRLPGDNYKGSEKPTQTHLFYDLNMLTDSLHENLGKYDCLFSFGKLQGGQKNAAKKFKYGEFEASQSDIYRFNDTQIKNEFDDQVKNEYHKTLKKSCRVCTKIF